MCSHAKMRIALLWGTHEVAGGDGDMPKFFGYSAPEIIYYPHSSDIFANVTEFWTPFTTVQAWEKMSP